MLGRGRRDHAISLNKDHDKDKKDEHDKDDGRAFAGKRSDPFFFDLSAFLDAVVHPTTPPSGRAFCDATPTDFFSLLNTNAMVIEVENEALVDDEDEAEDDDDASGTIGIWAVTMGSSGQLDRMGRPAINAVFNVGGAKNAFNAGKPSTDRANFESAFIARLHALSGGTYPAATERFIVELLLPDVLTYKVGTPAAGPLNGRALGDDVIDVELNLVTGGGLVPGAGAIPSDCVGKHTDLLTRFPYLGNPH